MARKPARFRLPKIGLLGRFSLLSLLATILLGVALGATLESQLHDRAIRNNAQSAELVAHFGIQPQLTPASLSQGLSPEAVQALNGLLRSGYTDSSVVAIEVKNAAGQVIYSNRPGQIGQVHAHDAFRKALAGKTTATVVHELDEVPWHEALIETHAPLRLRGAGSAPDGVFEIYMRYAPVAAAIRRDSATRRPGARRRPRSCSTARSSAIVARGVATAAPPG